MNHATRHRILSLALLLVSFLLWDVHAEDRTHTIQAGDTLGGIALTYGVTAHALQTHNNLANPDRLVVGQVLSIPPRPGEPVKYVVQSGDTLGGIARDHGVHARTIIEFNELSNPDQLRVGQVLMIPSVSAAARPGPALSASLRRDLDRVRVRPGWRHVVIHHSGTARGNVRDMDRYHREHRRMENGLGYHFVIGNGNGMVDGEIAIGPRWANQMAGGHLASETQNKFAIGICLVGNFEETRPTAKQLESLRALIIYLQTRCTIPVSRVTTHTLINVRPTACPGRHFPTESFLRSL